MVTGLVRGSTGLEAQALSLLIDLFQYIALPPFTISFVGARLGSGPESGSPEMLVKNADS